MKYLLIAFAALGMYACSDCYECKQNSYITDINGNIIDSTQVVEDVCTADQDVLDDYYNDGYICQ